LLPCGICRRAYARLWLRRRRPRLRALPRRNLLLRRQRHVLHVRTVHSGHVLQRQCVPFLHRLPGRHLFTARCRYVLPSQHVVRPGRQGVLAVPAGNVHGLGEPQVRNGLCVFARNLAARVPATNRPLSPNPKQPGFKQASRAQSAPWRAPRVPPIAACAPWEGFRESRAAWRALLAARGCLRSPRARERAAHPALLASPAQPRARAVTRGTLFFQTARARRARLASTKRVLGSPRAAGAPLGRRPP